MTYRDWDRAASKTNYKRRWEVSQRALTQALHENRVRDKCLEIAMEALEWCASNTMECVADEAMIQIHQRLAELEPEEKTE